jgi:hypothetical protein
MLSHLRQRVVDTLATAATATLSSHDPAGIQVNIFPCEARELVLFLLVPTTSDHLFNLESNSEVVVWTESWQARGIGRLLSEAPAGLALLERPDAAWCQLVAVYPSRLQIERSSGSEYAETIDID